MPNDPNLPTIKIEFSPTTAPLATPVWVDITAYLLDEGFSIRRGRQDETTPIQAGRATLTLDNTLRYFDPEYTSGIYGSNIRPMKRIRISFVWNATSRPQFTGYVESWRPENDMQGRAVCRVSCVDALGSFFARQSLGGEVYLQPIQPRSFAISNDASYAAPSGWSAVYQEIPQPNARKITMSIPGTITTPSGVFVAIIGTDTGGGTVTENHALFGTNPAITTSTVFKTITRIEIAATGNGDVFDSGDIGKIVTVGMNNTFASEYSGDALNTLLNAALWPSGERSIQSGVSLIQSYTVSGGSVLQYAQAITDTENGLLFVSRDGLVTFKNRHNAINTASLATFGDGGGTELPYGRIGLDYGDRYIFNVARGQRVGGVEQTAQNAASSLAYFPRVYPSRGQSLATTDTEVADEVAYRVARYKDMVLRIATLAPVGQKLPATAWPIILAADLGQQYTVLHRPPIGDLISKLAIVESINITMNAAHDITFEWGLSPGTIGSFLVMDDATLGRVDFNAVAF